MSPSIAAVETVGINLVILVGEVTSPVVSRTLASGDTASSFDIATVTESGRISVPVSVAGECDIATVGAELCVVGYVRRRFFRSGAGVTSRTEVVAESVVPMRRRAQARTVATRALENLSEFLET